MSSFEATITLSEEDVKDGFSPLEDRVYSAALRKWNDDSSVNAGPLVLLPMSTPAAASATVYRHTDEGDFVRHTAIVPLADMEHCDTRTETIQITLNSEEWLEHWNGNYIERKETISAKMMEALPHVHEDTMRWDIQIGDTRDGWDMESRVTIAVPDEDTKTVYRLKLGDRVVDSADFSDFEEALLAAEALIEVSPRVTGVGVVTEVLRTDGSPLVQREVLSATATVNVSWAEITEDTPRKGFYVSFAYHD